jgi:hypothetical protein
MLQHRIRVVVAAATVCLLLAVPMTVGASGSTTITLNSFAIETFTATGGVVCSSGTATTDFHKFGGGGAAGSFHLTKTLVCDDGSGSFTIEVNAATKFGTPTDQGGWGVLSGTDQYATLHGGGNLVGTYVPDGIIDVYTGSLTR